MKNLHIIATDKPSLGKYLVFNKEGNLCIWETNTMGSQRRLLRQHIYITNDEEIKEGDYFLYNRIEIRFKTNGTEYHGGNLCHISGNRRYSVDKSKKIILTTDQSLDGIQQIDDEFLEWFVNNPSCEEVTVKHKDVVQYGNMTMYDHNGDGSYYFCKDCEVETSRSKEELLKFGVEYYKIIIPKEEPKQERMYSEEDMEEAFTNGLNRSFDSDFDRWFEQFKKK